MICRQIMWSWSPEPICVPYTWWLSHARLLMRTLADRPRARLLSAPEAQVRPQQAGTLRVCMLLG